ncbi:MAG TPA: MATE family efflux transporter [Dialister sp.]|nr:MATE family efflux transporter [Dialister sp.]
MTKDFDFTTGSIPKKILLFSLPLMAGNIFQQLYNVVDTLVVGRFLGEAPLAAVGSAYTLMIFLTSILIGLTMGSGVYFSICFGQKNQKLLKQSIYISFLSIGGITLFLNGLSYLLLGEITTFMQIPAEVAPYFKDYLQWVYGGIVAVFLYNYFAALLRAVGNAMIPLYFLILSSLINIGLDLLFVLSFHWGVVGAAQATVIAQYASGIGMLLYYLLRRKDLSVSSADRKWDQAIFRDISKLSLLTSLQQSIMNFGILLVQGLVNSFGTIVMAAFAAGVKIDTLAYSPLMDFGNAFSTAIAQNYGAGNKKRIHDCVIASGKMVVSFALLISGIIYFFAPQLMGFFVPETATETIAIGTGYLRIEGACYVGIGILSMLYAYYRAIKQPGMSVILTILSLGSRVVLAYGLSSLPFFGVTGIWLSIPIGWALADVYGIWKGIRR